MPELLELPENSVITFPEGLPGFEDSRKFVLLQPEELAPLFLFQSVTEEHVSVPVVPVQMMVKDYRLHVGSEDRDILELTEDPRVGENVFCLVVIILSREKQPPTYNLFAPIVINAATRRGKQIMQIDSDYPSVLPLPSK